MATRFPDMLQPVDSIEDHINHFFDRVVACVEYRRRTLLAEANEKRLEKAARETHRTKQQEELMTVKTDVERKIKFNQLREFQEKVLDEIEEKLSELRLRDPETRLVFRGEFEQLEQLIQNAGDVLEEEVIPRYKEMRKVLEVGKEGKNPGKLSDPTAIAIDDNSNHIYVTESCPPRVSIFSDSGEFLNSFTNEHMKFLHGIAIHRNNIYVSDEGVDGVFQFKIESDIRLVARLVGRGSEDGKFDHPQQLAVSDNGEVFVTDCYNNRVQILDESLRFQRSITHETMGSPYDVKLTNEEIFVLTDSFPCILVFSHAGEKLRSFITLGEGFQFMGAHFFCLDAEKNMIIGDNIAHKLKIFSPDGTLIHSIEGFSKPLYLLNFLHPGTIFSLSIRGIVLTKQMKLVVIDAGKSFRIQIFSS